MTLKVLSAGAVKAAITGLAPSFTRDTGSAVEFTFGTAGNIRQRLAAGEAGDIAIATTPALGLMARDGLIIVESTTPFGRTLTGICVKAGAQAPDISTVDKFRQVLLDVPSFAYTDPAAGGTSGTFFAGLLQRLELTDIVNAKAVLCTGGEDVAEKVAAGTAAAGSTFISEMLIVPGATVVGPLPSQIGNETAYAGAVLASSTQADAAAAFLAHLTAPDHRETWNRAGFV